MPRKIAVLFVHGVEIRDPDYATGAIARLRRHFARHTAGTPGADEALEIEPAYWVPPIDDREDKLLEHTFDGRAVPLYRALDRLVTKVNAGSLLALVPVALSALVRRVPGVTTMDYPTLRWAVTYFVGDAIVYQATPGDTHMYDTVHGRIADALASLADRAGPDAPLCVIAHSLGTVIVCDHVWDRQQRAAAGGGRGRDGVSPLEACETLALLYTLGSPIPLWTLRYRDFGEPIAFPAPRLHRHHPRITGEWVNFHDRSDIVAYPLRGLSKKYAEAVSEDRAVSVGPPLVRSTPLSHLLYWNDDAVMAPIGESVARTWRAANSPKSKKSKKGRTPKPVA